MRRVEANILVRRPLEAVFAFMSVAANHARFIPNMRAFRQTSPGAFGQVGTSLRGTLQILGRKIELPYQITQFEPQTKLAMKGALGPILFEDGYVLEPVEAGGTRIAFWVELTPTGIAVLAGPWMGFIGRTHAAETLANLKKVLETTV